MTHINSRLLLAAALTLSVSAFTAHADDRVDHFKGQEAKTVAEAYENLENYNHKLEKLLEGELSAESMAEIHRITYTLENALQKLDSKLDAIEETLEKVHQASERNDISVTREKGKQYLDLSGEIIRKK